MQYSKFLKKNWQKVENKSFYYNSTHNFLVVDTLRVNCKGNSSIRKTVNGISVEWMNYYEGQFCFNVNNNKNPMIQKDYIVNIEGKEEYVYSYYFTFFDGYFKKFNLNADSNCNYWGSEINLSDTLKIPVVHNITDLLAFSLAKNLIFESLTEEQKETFVIMVDFYKKEYINVTDGKIQYTDIFDKKCKDGSIKKEIKELNVQKIEDCDINNFGKVDSRLIIDTLVKVDKVRADIEPYDEKMLEDINLGHWDLWYKDNSNETMVEFDCKLVGRNPASDIHEDGVVAIDFGTKSTVAVYQDGGERIIPMRIGNGNLKADIDKSSFENPTVMEFINLESFMETYKKSAGRPYTKWEDLVISHQAEQELASNSNKSDSFYSFFYDLKQWANDKTRRIRIKDSKSNEYPLKAFTELEDDDFNPIEVYAYYLGLYINNMRNGIYMNYILSFPVTYEKAVRDKIILSFENGIKKSLPLAILNDEELMSMFRVEQGANEPAAYAVCALTEYGFYDTEEPVYFGIFDFGGGTSDFDYGVWSMYETTQRVARYDNVISHFGAGGDKYLGGENILELLAFEVFKKNEKILRNNSIQFIKPVECEEFLGSDILISESQEAKLNTKQLIEKLRPIWENTQEKSSIKNSIKLNLYNSKGEQISGISLVVDVAELENLIEKRIEKGVINFFEGMSMAFNENNSKDMKKIIIFLAGNSSKSPLVKKLFDRHIPKYEDKLKTKLNLTLEEKPVEGKTIDEIEAKLETKNKNETDKIILNTSTLFSIYPPLGSEEAKKIQAENGVSKEDIESPFAPNGKTGVAYGLIESQSGSRIKVISEIEACEEIKFKYYIGFNNRRKFNVILDRDVAYNEWVEFIDSSESDFELYYTDQPSAVTNSLSILSVKKKMIHLAETHKEGMVYIRAVEPSVIEYVAALPKNMEAKKYVTSPVRINLDKN